MFATQSPSTPFRQTGHYTPVRPSPLGPRSSNIATPPWTMGSPTRGQSQQTQKPSGDENTSFSPVAFPSLSNDNGSRQLPRQHHSSPIFATSAAPATPFFFSPNPSNMKSPTSPSPSTRTNKFADRYASQVANPMKSSTGLTRSKTRKMFLNKVRNGREEGRFEARGEQMMHADYLADKRRWEESMARDMMVQEPDEMEDDMLPDESDIRALDEYVSQEEAMERAMREDIEQQNGSFSDDEYDDIFMTLPDSLGHQSQDMDMS